MARNPTNQPDYSILAAFGAGIVRPKSSFSYQCGLVLVTVTLLLLVLVYVALVAATAYLVYYHAAFHWTPIMRWGGSHGRLMILKFLCYLVPLLAGIVVVFFLFKPLLARRSKQAQPLALNPADNPLLYAFIAKICDVVGAPTPTRIDLDCQVNASASFRRGFLSLFGRDLVLTIGMPLAANLSAREFAGVIAHEFGHFTQGVAMRLDYIIRSIIRWFARVAYERDAWDEILESWTEEDDEANWLTVVAALIQAAVWLSRLILKTLMLIGVIVGGFISRQMEYDADAYEIKVAGSAAFESAMRKLATLDAAMEASGKQLGAAWEKTGTLPDNLPEVLRSSHEKLPPKVVEKINNTLGLQRTSLFDSHPSPADRIRCARQADDPGIFHDARAASELFASFEHPARYVTLLHYTEDLGIPITPQMLTHVEVKSASGAPSGSSPAPADSAEAEAWMFGLLPFLLPLSVKPPAASADVAADTAELSQLSAGLRQIAEQIEPLGRQEAELADKLASARAAQTALSHGVALPPDLLGPPGLTTPLAALAENDALQAREDIRHSLREILPVLQRRLELGLSLALANADPAAAGDLQQQSSARIDWLNQQAAEFTRRQELAGALAVLDKLNTVKAAQGEDPALAQALEEHGAKVHALAAGGNAPASAEPPKARLRVQLGKDAAPRGTETDVIREQNRKWLAEYQAKVAELIATAASVESALA